MDWAAFQVDINTTDTVTPGSEVTFDVQITSTVENTATVRLLNWYYRERGNSSTYPGEKFGEFFGDGLQDDEYGFSKVLTLEPGQTVSLTLKGTLPDTWNEKSEICIVVNASDQGYMGQGDYYAAGDPQPPEMNISRQPRKRLHSRSK